MAKKYKNITFQYQIKPLGTADAVTSALKNKKIFKSDTSVILYGDTPLISFDTLNRALKEFKRKKTDLSVISMIVNNMNNSYGKLILKEDKLEKIVEKSELGKNQSNLNLCNSGIMIIKTNYLIEQLKKIKNQNLKKEFFLTDLVEIFNKENYKVSYFNSKIIWEKSF